MRETKKIVTKGGIEVELYTYITGGEARQIQSIFLEGMKFKVGTDGQTTSNEMDASLASVAQDKTIELLVVSVKGVKENVLKAILDLPKNDFDEVLAEIDKVQTPLTEEKKTK